MFIVNQEYPRDDLKRFAETKALQTGILYRSGAKPNEVEFVLLTSGGKAKKKLGYGDQKLANGKWEYFGQGTEGNQDPNRMPNRMLLDRNSTKLLFSTRQPTSDEIKSRGHERKRYKFEGAFKYESWTYFSPDSGDRKGDQLICATLSPMGEIPFVAETASPVKKVVGPDLTEAPDDDPNKRVLTSKSIRKGQRKFKENLLNAYSGKCAITGTSIEEALVAAHIHDHAKSGVNAIENGLLLRADVHNLFDFGLIRINPETLLVELTKSLISSEYAALHGKKISSRSDGGYPNSQYLARKYKNERMR